MERLEIIVEQLEESKRLIQPGSIPHLRMALLLLDNVVEILMYRQVMDNFIVSRWYENMLQSMLEIRRRQMDAQRLRDQDEHISDLRSHIISVSRKGKIERFFDEKVKFLTEKQKLNSSVAEVLSIIHRYRNLA